MVEYLDKKGNNLEKGFYFLEKFSDLYYFNGKYDPDSFPLFENINQIGNEISLQAHLTRRLNKINKKQVEDILNESKKKINWLEEKLK